MQMRRQAERRAFLEEEMLDLLALSLLPCRQHCLAGGTVCHYAILFTPQQDIAGDGSFPRTRKRWFISKKAMTIPASARPPSSLANRTLRLLRPGPARGQLSPNPLL